MGYWVNTTYINHGNVAEVVNAFVALCRAEGMEHILPPVQRERLVVEPLQYDCALHNDLWGAAIFPGAPSWTVIQTAPLELLAERAPGSTRMRIVELCIQLSASAFQLNIYDSTGIILAEISKEGEVLISGLNMLAREPLEWNGEQLSEDLFKAQFRLHPFQGIIADAELGDDMAEIIAQHFGAQNAAFCNNLVSVDTLISHKPFIAPRGQAYYFKWLGHTRQRYSPCASWAEYHAVIARD